MHRHILYNTLFSYKKQADQALGGVLEARLYRARGGISSISLVEGKNDVVSKDVTELNPSQKHKRISKNIKGVARPVQVQVYLPAARGALNSLDSQACLGVVECRHAGWVVVRLPGDLRDPASASPARSGGALL